MTDLRQLLTDIGERAGSYDVTERALTITRRRRRRRAAVGTTAAALAVAAIATWSLWPGAPGSAPDPAVSPSAGPSLPTSCTLGSLPLPDGATYGVVYQVDPTGRYAVGGTDVDAKKYDRDLLFWDGDAVRRLSLPGRLQYFHDVNSAGTALASAVIDGKESAWVYRDGEFTRLDGEAFASDLNESGVIAGTISSGPDGPGGQPVRWRTPDSPMELLPLPPGDWRHGVLVRGIDDDGTIVMGGYENSAKDQMAYALRPDGSWQELTPTIDGVTGRNVSVYAIRGGWVVGQVLLPDGTGQRGSGITGVLWNLRTGKAQSLGRSGPPTVVNAQGWTVHETEPVFGPRGQTRTPVPTPAGSLWLLSPAGDRTAVPAPAGQTPWHVQVYSVSDDGRVLVGLRQLSEPYGKDHVPVRWRCS
ncbi:hypothetical protein ACFQY4_08115 [Catellatospora bangladeshensis]|uniref:Uncharacterized protein n=1 Tax=Catellatospora bangladeshensis TaxID=310355 RepID=A0A8J3JIK7_9ACTN|nr:hypothetical protein [Catellatospora bangladeshensis]GIF78814.1 hypothetical protein Cba03nite_01630 [Catellatospora bangladeshensis]